MRALIMAGGRGRRLRPLTDDTPKPLIEVGGMAMIDRIVAQARDAGCDPVYVSVGWMADAVKAHLRSAVRYVEEPEPLGTIGALGLLEKSEDHTLVVNCDVLTSLDFSEIIDWHETVKADITIGARSWAYSVPYGVLGIEGHWVTGVEEKPTRSEYIAAGVYVVGWDVPVPSGHLDMPDFVRWLADDGRRISYYPITGRWIDIGSHEDLKRAREGM